MNQIERRYRRKMKISLGLFISAIILAILLLIAYLGLNVGHYTIVVSDTHKVLSISEDPLVTKGRTTRLNAKKVVDAFHYSADSLPVDIDRDNQEVDGATFDGSHNGRHYLAYTFYAKNVGDTKVRYRNEIVVKDQVNNMYDFLRVRLYRGGNPVTYASATKGEPYIKDADGKWIREYRECIGESTPEYNAERDATWNVCSAKEAINNDRAESFVSNETIADRLEELKAQEKVRYTVVIWIEGADPECVGDPLTDRAAIVLSMKLTVIELVREGDAL